MTKSKGAPELPVAEVPAPISGLGEEKNRDSVDAVIDNIVSALTKPIKEGAGEEKVVGEVITVMGKDYPQAVENMNEVFMARKWGDGLPLIPPTEEAVNRMLKGTSRSPDEVVGILEHRKGITTVKIVAINAVMAGCKPEYLSVVLAAVKAVTEPAYNLYGVQVTTAPAIPLLMINGPIRNELNIHSAMGSWGPGHPANATIGRAFNLVMTTAGGRAETSMSSVADPGRFTWCIGENEEELPPGWEPMHVEKGYKPEESTVTVMNVHWRSPIHGFFAPTTDEEAIEHVSKTISEQEPHWYGEGLLVLLPEIAAQLARKAPTKAELKKILLVSTQVPWRELKQRQQARVGDFPPKGFKIPSDDTMLSPILSQPEDINIIVTGGAGRHSYFLYPWIRTHTVTSPIDEWK